MRNCSFSAKACAAREASSRESRSAKQRIAQILSGRATLLGDAQDRLMLGACNVYRPKLQTVDYQGYCSAGHKTEDDDGVGNCHWSNQRSRGVVQRS